MRCLFILVIFLNDLKRKYFGSAALLLISSIIVKAVSAVYKIPLTAYIGATGRGYFNIAYNLYMPLHAVVMGAFPVAVSHLVSKYNFCGNSTKIYSIRIAANRLFFIIGLLGTGLMLLIAKPYSALIASSPKSLATIYALAPTALFSSMAAARRSVAEGYMNMLPTSVSQVIEAVFKVVFGLLFAKYTMAALYNRYLVSGAVLGTFCADDIQAFSVIYPITSAAAVCGVTLGAFASLVYLGAYASVKYNSRPLNNRCSISGSAREIVSFSLPIIASTLIQSISVFAYNSAVQFCLSLADFNALKQEFADCLAVNSTPDEDVTTYIYGLFSTAQDFKNIVPGFTMALGVAAVPALSAAFEDDNGNRLSVMANSIFKYTAILSIGGGAYLSLVSENLLALFYQNSNYDIVLGCTGLIKFMGFTMLLYSLSGTAVFAVQAIGCASKSIPALIASGVLRVFLCAALVSNARYNIFGAAVADAAAYLIILISNLYIFGKYSGIKYQFSQMLLKPALCSLAAFFGSRMIFSALFDFQGNLLKFLVFSTVFGVIFTAGLFLSKTIKFSEFKILQYG